MAARDPNVPQLDFPQLTADIIRELRLTGQVGLLDFLDQIRPVYIVASRGGALDVVSTPPIYASAEVFHGSAINPVANTVIADSGPLPAGTYDLHGNISYIGSINVLGANSTLVMEHRDAANAATLATFLSLIGSSGVLASVATLPIMGYTLALNERIRIRSPLVNNVVSGGVSGSIFMRLRPTP